MQATILSGMAKVFSHGIPSRYQPLQALHALADESVHFQLAYLGDCYAQNLLIHCEGLPAYTAYQVRPIAVQLAAHPNSDDDYLGKEPGLYPDFLEPTDLALRREGSALYWQSIFFEAQPPAGHYDITLRITDLDDNNLWQGSFPLDVAAAALPPQALLYTRWFHCDALSAYYQEPLWSERYFAILKNFLQAAVDMGMNTILTPIHTPPLDTDIGAYRQTAQLIDITQQGDTYTFAFDKLDRFVALCQSVGITHFEMAHLYSQWGAAAAPQIVAAVSGECRRIFGWDTPATGAAYQNFLSQYLPALTAHLKKLAIAERCRFHISDEPNLNNLAAYLAAKEQAQPYLKGFVLMDALSNLDFYQQGVVTHPVAANDHIKPFLDANVPDFWVYYCCGQGKDVSNCFVAMGGERTRILGVQLYQFGITGFLQWGYNFYYGRNSRYPIDPYRTADGDNSWPAGDPFIVYPGKDGHALPSLRFMHTKKALEDMRALQLLESLTSRSHVLALLAEGLSQPLTFTEYPRDEQHLLNLRQKIHAAITARC